MANQKDLTIADYNMSMATKEHYELQAASYRSSDEYIRMIGLYPILKNSIEACEDEILVA